MKSNRRKFLQNIGAVTAGLTFGSTTPVVTSCTTNPESNEDEDGQIIFIGDKIAIAETTYGKVRGFIHKDIHNFLGIP